MHIMEFDDRPDFAKRLEKARIARGFLTAKDAARRHGWVYETYIQHEQGIRGISRAASKYAKAFKVSEAWLLTGEGPGITGGDTPSLEEAMRLLPHATDEALQAALTILRLGQKRGEPRTPRTEPDDPLPSKPG